jgi:hypothetical protein
MTYTISPVIPTIAAAGSFTTSPEYALALIDQALRSMYRETGGIARPDTLWLSPEVFYYFQGEMLSYSLDKSLMQSLLEINPTIRNVAPQPVLRALRVDPAQVNSNGCTWDRLAAVTGAFQLQAAVLFNSQAVAHPDCIGWLVGGEEIYHPTETLAIVGV